MSFVLRQWVIYNIEMLASIIASIVFVCVILVIIVLLIIQHIKNQKLIATVTDLDRGTGSERKLILKLLKYGISPKAIFHDAYFQKSNGEYTQTDIIVPTKVGVIVFEVKDYSGWIFGRGHHQYWTQVLAYGKEKYRFYNPVKQNEGHIINVKKLLPQFANVPFYSVVVFYGNCELKNVSSIPENVIIIYPSQITSTLNYILYSNPPALYSNKREIINLFAQAVENGANPDVVNSHIEKMRQRYPDKSTNYMLERVIRRILRGAFMINRRRNFW